MTTGLSLTLGAILISLCGCARPTSAAPLSQEQWTEKIHAGWVGKVAAGSGALPTEMWSKEAIRLKYGELSAPPQTPTSRGPLDDTTLAFLGWRGAQEHGPAFTSEDIAREWVDHLTDADLKGGGFGKEFLSTLTRLRQGEKPPIRTGSPRAEWIAAQMRAEIWGMLAPGDPGRAAEYAVRDASIFNTGNGLYAAQFTAVLASQLMVDPDIGGAIGVARTYIPGDSALAKAIDNTLAWHEQVPADWEQVHKRFVETYRDRSLEERFAQWSPVWLVETGGWPEADVLAEYQGAKDVLRTHPFSDTEPARLTTEVSVPAAGGTLKVCVNCNDYPPTVDWLLRVRLGETVAEQPIRQTDGRPQWQDFAFDLAPWAGQTLTIVLENALLNKMAWEAGFWAVPELLDSEGHALESKRPANGVYRYPVSFAPAILPETFSVLIGLLYGEGDFRKSVSLTTMCGFDTDCNAGTVGCLMGLRNGLGAIPSDWRDPLDDAYDLQVTGLPRHWRIADLAAQMAETGAALAR
jgi:ADP-ribosylglycohydrolase